MRFAFIALLIAGCGAKTRLGVRASIDGGPLDAGSIDAPRCSSDDDCDHRFTCTFERCIDGRCVREEHPEICDDELYCTGADSCDVDRGCVVSSIACDDFVDCTEDFCDEANDGCQHDPNPFLCPLSHRCDPFLGCVARALVHDSNTLYEIDLPSGELHLLGLSPVALLDLALHSNGALYGATGGGLVRVDYIEGTYEVIAPIAGAFNALDVAPDGTVYGASDDSVWSFDIASGTAALAAQLPRGFVTSGDLAFVEGRLYATVADSHLSPRPDSLARVDLGRGTAEIVGRVGAVGHRCTYGLAPFGATLYAMTCDGKLLSIDTTNGEGTLLRTTTASFWGAGAR